LFCFGARSKSRKVKLRRQRGAVVAICDDGERAVTKEQNQERIA